MIVKLSKEVHVHQHTPTLAAGPPAGNLCSMDDDVGISSNDKLAALLAYSIVVLGFFLFALIFPNRHHPPGRGRYIAFKILLHALSILLVCLSFSFSLMMRSMNILATSSTLSLAAIYVGHRLWQSTATALDTDLEVYGGCEEEIHQLLETSTGVASIMFTGWFGMASSESEEARRDARFLASRYLVFFTSVAASLMLVKAFPRRRLSPSPRRPVRELRALVCVLVAAVDTTALAVAAAEVGRRCAALGLVPEAVALAVGCAQWAKHRWGLPIPLPAWLQLQDGHGGGDQGQGSRYLNRRIQSSSQIVMVLAAGIFMPMAIEHSNNTRKQQAMHLPTLLCTFMTFFCGLSLRGLVGECFGPVPGPRRYVAIKSLVHACALLLVSLSFSLSLMMRMNAVATSLTLAAAAAYVAHRLWQCKATGIEADVEAYGGCEEQLQKLLDLSTSVTSTLFGGWFGMAFFYFRNYPEEAHDARFVPSEYLTFFTSVAASLMLLKAVRKRAEGPQQVDEILALLYALVTGVVTTALAIAASKVGGYAVLALVPEAIALAAWGVRRWDGRPGRKKRLLPLRWQDLLNYGGGGHGGGGHAGGEPPAHGLVTMALPLLLGVLAYHVKDIERALSTLYDEAFVLFAAAAAVAALGWRLLTQPPTLVKYPEAQAAATVLSFSTFLLFITTVLAFLGVIFGW